MSVTSAAAIAANRYGLGARPGDLAKIGADARGWLTAQLEGDFVVLTDAGLRSSDDILSEVARKEKASRDIYRPIYAVEVGARAREAVGTSRPFIERLTHFWTNHFAVSVDKNHLLGIAGSFEREAIRPHVIGRFADMLLAAERHPAMLIYLDNKNSVGPGSAFGRRTNARRGVRKAGINENLAREILELHTLGVEGGYTQADVTAFANVITGWSVGRGSGETGRRQAGRFVFRNDLHEPGEKRVLGRRYADDGERQGVAVLRDLAASPATARLVARKLVCHFIADEPPPTAIDRVARAFLDSDGHLPAVYRALVDSPEAWQQAYAKFKTPSDYVFSAYRALSMPVSANTSIVKSFDVLGQRTYNPGSPAGWPDRNADWDGAYAVLKRIAWAHAIGQRLGSRRDAGMLAPLLLGNLAGSPTPGVIARAASGAQALTLLLTAPEFMRR